MSVDVGKQRESVKEGHIQPWLCSFGSDLQTSGPYANDWLIALVLHGSFGVPRCGGQVRTKPRSPMPARVCWSYATTVSSAPYRWTLPLLDLCVSSPQGVDHLYATREKVRRCNCPGFGLCRSFWVMPGHTASINVSHRDRLSVQSSFWRLFVAGEEWFVS